MIKLEEALKNVAESYVCDMEKFGYNAEFLELQLAQNKNFYNTLLGELSKHRPENVAPMKFKRYNQKEIKTIILSIMIDILGKDFAPQIMEYINITSKYVFPHPVNGINVREVNDDYSKVSVSEIKIANLGTSISAVDTSEQYVSNLLLPFNGPKFNEYFGNLHYHCIPHLMMGKIFAFELDKQTNDDIYDKNNLLKYSSSAEQIEVAKLFQKVYRKDPSEKNRILALYSKHFSYSCIMSDFYASYLFYFYLQNPTEFLDLYRSLIKGEVNVPDYLGYFNADFSLRKVREPYMHDIRSRTLNSA